MFVEFCVFDRFGLGVSESALTNVPDVCLAWKGAGAAVSDTCEDIALLVTLGGHGGGLAPGLATAFAIVKFGLIGIAIGYVLIGLFGRLRPAVETSG